MDNSHVGNNVQGEESDFEFMLTEEVKEDKATELERLKFRKSYFEYCIMKPELNIVAKLLLEKGYSISKAFKDAFKAGNYQQLFQLLKSMDAQSVKDAVKIKDELGRNIFHALSKAPENTAFVDICNTLMNDYNLDPNETDDEGTTPIMLAAKEGKLDLVKALECVGCSIKDTNNKQENCIHLLMKGTRIKKYNRSLLKYLISKGVDFNSTYEEPEYASPKDEVAYKCTPLIHLIRTEHLEVWDKGDLLDDIFEQRSLRIDPNQTDSDGKDIFMHLAILNDYELCKYIIKCVSSNYAKTSDIKENGLANGHLENGFAKSNLRAVKAQTIQDQVHKERKPVQEEEEETIVTSKFELFQQDLKDKKELEKQIVQTNGNHIESPVVDQPAAEYKYGINLCRVDELGRSVVHYILTPVSYGSFENDNFLEFMLKFGFKGDIVDKEGLKPVDYALRQSTGTMLEVFKDFKLAPADLEIDANICSYRKIEDWENVNYMKDAQDFLDLVKMNVDKEKLVPCDPAGKFNDDCIVYEDPEKGYYDCHLTRVDIGREERDDYLFYKLQIVYDKGRDLWMLFTRWGRIGEEGAFQKTPYSKEECIQQFETIFFNKTKNEWKDRANFKKHWWKYQLINVNYSNMCHKDYLVPFDLTNAKPSNLHPSVQEIMREMTQVAMYVKGLQNSGIDAEQMPFSDINRSDLLKARESLTKLREILEELEPMEAQLNRFNKDGKDKIVALREKMWYHSSRFYELIPHEQYKNEIVPPINKMSVLKEKAEMIDNLINFEMASKILLGAHKAQKLGVQNDGAQRLNSKATEDMNPLDYCVKAMGVEINALDKASSEFNILKEYCVRTWPENKHAAKKIRNIFKIQRKGEGEAYEQFDDLSNKFLLFHGSRISNFMGIMSQGLRVAPPEAPKTGYMFGKGVYFADMFQKSINYCNDFNASPDGSKYVLLCEVAVGKSYKLTHAQYMDEPPEGCDSTQGLGRSGPCYAKCFTFPEGYKIPKGKYLDYEYDDNTQRNVYLRHNEFIIYKSNNKNQNKVNHKALPSDSNPGQIKMRDLIQVK